MNIRAVFGFASLVAFMGLSIAACSSSDNAASSAAAGTCPAVGSKACPNDTATVQSDVDDCNKAKSDAKCGADYTAVLMCAGSNVSCGADGKADSTKVTTACMSQLTAYTNCLTGSTTTPDAGGTTPPVDSGATTPVDAATGG